MQLLPDCRAFSTCNHDIQSGIAVVPDHIHDTVLRLGEAGGKGVQRKLKLDRIRCPDSDNGIITICGVWQEAKDPQNPLNFLTQDHRETRDPRVLLRVHTKGPKNASGVPGEMTLYWGDPQILAEGRGVFFFGREAITFRDVLCVMKIGDAITVTPSGQQIPTSYVIYHDGIRPSYLLPNVFQRQIVTPWLKKAKEDDVRKALERAEAQKCHKLAQLLRTKIDQEATVP